MIAHEELVQHVRNTTIPDKERIMRMRMLIKTATEPLADQSEASRLQRLFNNAYLNLQLALIADEPGMIKNCRHDCLRVIAEIEQNKRAERGMRREKPMMEAGMGGENTVMQ